MMLAFSFRPTPPSPFVRVAGAMKLRYTTRTKNISARIIDHRSPRRYVDLLIFLALSLSYFLKTESLISGIHYHAILLILQHSQHSNHGCNNG